jgi:hypothetical protein
MHVPICPEIATLDDETLSAEIEDDNAHILNDCSLIISLRVPDDIPVQSAPPSHII